jgi:uncharacterized phage protein gp47/JayE
MAINTQTFAQIVSNAVTAIQGGASQLVDMTVGSILRAFTEAIGALTLWLQGVALQIAALTRFASSNGPDADSWAADFGFARESAKPANGPVTCARFTATAQASVPVGSVVQTSDGTQKYSVIADSTQSAYNATLGAYVMAPGTTSCTVSVVSQSVSASGNAAAGAINTVGNPLPGIDTVTNAAAFTNGSDGELDPAMKARFVSYINSLSRATRGAITYAVTSLQLGVNMTLTENFTYSGTADQGYFYVVVDDGSGAPSTEFLSTVSNAIDAVRPIGSTFGVFAPVIVTANVAMTVTAATGYLHSDVAAAVSAALLAYINSLPLGTLLSFTRLVQVAYDASPGVANISAVTVNGGTSDVAVSSQQVAKAGTITIS